MPSSNHTLFVRGRVLAGVIALAALMTPGAANAQLAPLYNQLVNTIQQALVNKLMAAMGVGVEGAVEQSSAALRGEILKGAVASKSVAEGLESYRQTIKLQNAAQDTADSLRQPATTCATMAVQGSIGSATQTSKARMATSQAKVLSKVSGNTNTIAAMDTAHQTTNATLCTADEAARGICSVNPTYSDLAGADSNAAYLFQSADGSATYDGTRSGAQAAAADSYITRVVAGIPEEQLHGTTYAKNPQGRAYIELMRRYSAVLSMSAYSLNQIKEAHTAQVGLGNDTQMANATGFPQGKADMSMLEAVQRFVATKFSPDSIKDAATATNENSILRDMAQMEAFKLWIGHQTLLNDTRSEALMAHQLALMTEQTLRPQLDAQRIAASRITNK